SRNAPVTLMSAIRIDDRAPTAVPSSPRRRRRGARVGAGCDALSSFVLWPAAMHTSVGARASQRNVGAGRGRREGREGMGVIDYRTSVLIPKLCRVRPRQ